MDSPTFWPGFLRSWALIKVLLPTFFCLVLPFPKAYDTTPLPQNPGRRKIWQKIHFLGSSASGSKPPAKNYLRGVKGALKILRWSIQWVKKCFAVTHRHTKTNRGNSFCICVRGKEGNYKPYKISTSSLFEGLRKAGTERTRRKASV